MKLTRTHKLPGAIGLGLILLAACGPGRGPKAERKVTQRSFGQTRDGQSVDLFTLMNSNGLEAAITNFGAIVVSLKVPDRDGRLEDVVLGFDSLDGYLGQHPYFGAIVGRYGNRIGKGKFTLNGVDYTLARNNGDNHLHGGIKGFDKALWKARETVVAGSLGLELTYLSKDGEEGYPGNLSVAVHYSLNDANELRIDYSAASDKDTVVNLTNHSYFNLAGQGREDILKHRLILHAEKFAPVDAGLIPTGELRSVDGTPFDFRRPVEIGARIQQDDEQLGFGGGYDHNFVLSVPGPALHHAARVYEPGSGRVLEVLTTEPGVQFYTGNFLDGTIRGKGGVAYQKRSGFCLETQHFPDSPNQPGFPSTVLKAGDRFQSTTVYRFSTATE